MGRRKCAIENVEIMAAKAGMPCLQIIEEGQRAAEEQRGEPGRGLGEETA